MGRTELAELIERTCRHAACFATGFRNTGYRVLNDVVINQVLVPLVTKRLRAGWLPVFRKTCAAAPVGKEGRRCASASLPGLRLTPMWNAAWQRCCVLRRKKPRAGGNAFSKVIKDRHELHELHEFHEVNQRILTS